VVGGLAQVGERLGGDLLGAGHVPPVAHAQAAPVQPADAAARVAPCHAGAEGELGGGVRVGPVPLDLGADLVDPRLQGPGGRDLGVVEAQELLGGELVHGRAHLPPKAT
jgi:hypothetical protein